MKIAAFVPAKSTSDRIANKNLAILDGEHLFRRKLRQLKQVDKITDVYVDSDSTDLMDRAADLEVHRLLRPKHLASNATDGHELFAFEAGAAPDADIYVQALCTAPFLDAATIAQALDRLLADPEADGLVAVSRRKQYLWRDGAPDYGSGRIPNSIDLPDTVVECMSLYMVRRRPGAPPPTRRFGDRTILFELSPTEDLDVDNPADLALAEHICAGMRAQFNTRLRLLRGHLSSPVISDIFKEAGEKAVLSPRIRRLTGGKILGTAKTLELVELPDDGKDRRSRGWEGIYRALGSYEYIRPGDIIMVSTSIPSRAYFGDLNANLAIRAGAAGAVIDGFTRDTADVEALDFSVFAHGSYCDDIKYEGTVLTMNRAIEIGGVPVRNGDIVFGDRDGVVVCPEARWRQVEGEVWTALRREVQIRLNVMQGVDVGTILENHGAF